MQGGYKDKETLRDICYGRYTVATDPEKSFVTLGSVGRSADD